MQKPQFFPKSHGRAALVIAALIMASFMLSGCKDRDGDVQTPGYDTSLDGFNPRGLADQQRLCEAAGGTFSEAGGKAIFACIMPTSDANQSCQKASDCEGLCLSRSGTCAPVQPLFGCNEVRTETGMAAVLCVD